MPRMPSKKPQTLNLGAKKHRGRNQAPSPKHGKPFQLDVGDYYLRSLRPSDVNTEFVDWMNDPDVVSGLNFPSAKYSINDIRGWVTGAENIKTYLIGIFMAKGMKLIGFYYINVKTLNKTAILTVVIGNKDWWGKSVTEKTTPPLVQSFFVNRDIEKMGYRVTSKNRRIFFSLLKTGFEYEGCLKKEILTPKGERLDLYCFGLVKRS